MEPWFRRWFNESYLALYGHRDHAEAARQVEALARLLPPQRLQGARVCDLGCGSGRHLEGLVAAGVNAFGLDLSESLLSRVPKELANRVLRGDIRHLPFRSGTLQGLTSFFTSFGYFDTQEEHLATLVEWRRVLTDTGFLFLDLPNRERVRAELRPSETVELNGLSASITREIGGDPERVTKRISLVSNEGKIEEYCESVMLFSLEQITALLREAGFHRTTHFGDLSLRPFGVDSERMYVLADLSDQ